MVDRLDVMRRWTVMRTSGDVDRGESWRAAVEGPRVGYGEKIEVVEASSLDELRGAVEALRAKLDEMALHDNTRDPEDIGFQAAVDEMREFLSTLGGQSETPGNDWINDGLAAPPRKEQG